MKDYEPILKSSYFGKFNEIRERQRQEFMSHVSPEIRSRIFENPLPIGLEEYQERRMNSYEQKITESRLTNEAFIWKIKNALHNTQINQNPYKVNSTYLEYLINDGILELLKRFEKLSENRHKNT